MKLCNNCYDAEAQIDHDLCAVCYRVLNGLPVDTGLDGDGTYIAPLSELDFDGVTEHTAIGDEVETIDPDYVTSDDMSREELAKEFGVVWEQLSNDLE